MFTIRLDDPLASVLNDLGDLEREIPGAVTALREWLRVYKARALPASALNRAGIPWVN